MGIATLSTLLGLGIAYYQVKNYFLAELRSKAMSIAAAAAPTIDGDLLDTIRSPDQEKSPAYKKLQKQLREVRDINRRNDIYVKFVYTVFPAAKDSQNFLYQVDAEEDTPDFSHIGETVQDARENVLSEHTSEVYSPARFIENKWGIWITGFSPVYNKAGKYVATVAVDLGAGDVIDKLNNLLTAGLFSFLGAIILALLSAYFLSRQETLSLQSLCDGVIDIGRGNLNRRIHLATNDEFDDLAKAINGMVQGLQERDRLRLNFARYVSQHIMETIIKSETPLKLEGERRKVTLLFSDIRQFTQLAEKLDPEHVVSLLNEYFAVMVDIIFKNHGTLDKFLGDGMMIEYGVPLDDPFQELHAIKTAAEMQDALKHLCAKWESEGRPRITVGIGIHTGIAIVGNIGSEKRIEYTAVGDTVNVAARLEQLTKELKCPILVSETTVKPLEKKFAFKNLGPILLKGRTDPIIVYALINSFEHKHGAEELPPLKKGD